MDGVLDLKLWAQVTVKVPVHGGHQSDRYYIACLYEMHLDTRVVDIRHA